MVETQIINNNVENINSSVSFVGNSVSLIDQVKDTPKETLYDFAIKYLTRHTYLNSKALGFYYACEILNLTPTLQNSLFNKVKKYLTQRFGKTISTLLREKRITKYNNNQYKRVELTKTDSCSNEVRLTFYQGKFINPNYYS